MPRRSCEKTGEWRRREERREGILKFGRNEEVIEKKALSKVFVVLV